MCLVLQLSAVPGLTIYGPPPEKRGSPLCSFNVEGVHATDLSTFLDFEGEQSAACFIQVLQLLHFNSEHLILDYKSGGLTCVMMQALQCGQAITAHSRCTITWASMHQLVLPLTSITQRCACHRDMLCCFTGFVVTVSLLSDRIGAERFLWTCRVKWTHL